jgi:hypothetical protein
MFDLNTLVVPCSELNLYFPIIINDGGEIAGQGQLPSGDIHAFLLIPCKVDLSDEKGCAEGIEGTPAIRNNSAHASLNPTDLARLGLAHRELADQVRARFGRNRSLGPWSRKQIP